MSLLTLEWIEKAESKAEKLDAIRCLMQQCAIEMHDMSLEMSESDWQEYDEQSGDYCTHGLGQDISKLLEDGTF